MLNWTSLALWPHQKEALRNLTAYLRSASDNSFLVHMPTGSGKTGIIATLARFILKDDVKVLLVLAPRVALRDQLYAEVNGNFFIEKLGLGSSSDLKRILDKSNVVNFDDSFSGTFDTQGKRLIVISTIQKINTIHNSKKDTDKKVFSFFKTHTDLVIIDEGHYEPAVSWSTTIRALGEKRILFTATPYRNDFKHFDFTEDFVFSYSYNLALKGKFLRTVNFIHAGNGKSMLEPDDLVEEIEKIRLDHLKNDTYAKIIIRCESADRIVQIGEAILRKHKDEKYLVAFHENFGESGHPWKRKSVPKPDEMKQMKQVYWVHQFKLLEGVDNKDFRVLVIYDELGNERSLIQQIGRIIRNPDRVRNATAYVIDLFNKRLEKTWKKFRDFDSKLRGGKKDAIFLLGSPTKRLNEAISRNFTSTEYLFSKYREKYEDSSFQPESDLKIPLRVNFLQKSDKFDQNAFCKNLEERFKRSDYQYQQVIHSDIIVYYYRYAQNSEYFDEKYSFILKDGVCLVYNITDDLLAFLDTGSFLPLSDPDTFGILSSYPRKSLRKVFNKRQESFVNRVSAHGTNASLNAIESLSFSAGSIEKTPPFMENKSQVISTLGGYFVKDKILKNGKQKKVLAHRYLGFGNGRLSDGSQAVPLNVYKNWVDGIADLLTENVKPIELFNRFADIKEDITETDPRYVILSSETIAPYFYTVGDNQNLYIQSDAAKVTVKNKKFAFKIIANSKKYDAEIEFIKNRYLISCTDLSAAYIKNGLELYDDIIDYFNSTQLFKVLPKQPETIYHQFNFIHTVVRFGKKFDAKSFTVGKIIHSVYTKVTSEKGKCLPDKSSWSKDSLFGLLDSYLQNPLKSHTLYPVIGEAPDYAVCDDSNEEVADFFLAWTDPMKIVMVHAKYKEAEFSTKALEGVCRQAISNSRYISLYLGEDPPGLKNWSGEYVMKDVKGTLKTRVRRTSKGYDAQRTWKEMKSLINHPLCRREVWLFLGNMLNEKSLLTQLKKDDPNEFAINTVQFLNGTMQSIGNIVGTLKIIAVTDPSPKKGRAGTK